MITREQLTERILAMQPDLRARGISHMTLFGSRARGDAREDSDVDLMVDIDHPRFTILDLVGVEQDLTDHLGLPGSSHVTERHLGALRAPRRRRSDRGFLMKATLADRLGHIQTAIAHISELTGSFSDQEIASDAVKRAALERFVEIISEACRYIPNATRTEHPEIPWSRVTGIGNVLRHGYDVVTFETLLLIARTEIQDLARVIDLIIAETENGDAEASHLQP